MKYKYIGFDLDGTIGDSLPVCIESFRRTLRHFTGREYTDREITKYFGVDEIGLFRHLLPDQVDEAFAYYLDVYKQLLAERCPAPFPGVIPLLERLKNEGYTLFVITGKGRVCCDVTLEQYGIGHFFSGTFVGEPGRSNKANHLRTMMERLGCASDDLVYIGDVAGDIRACDKVCIRCISAAWAPGTKSFPLELRNPGNVCYELDDLPRMLTLGPNRIRRTLIRTFISPTVALSIDAIIGALFGALVGGALFGAIGGALGRAIFDGALIGSIVGSFVGALVDAVGSDAIIVGAIVGSFFGALVDAVGSDAIIVGAIVGALVGTIGGAISGVIIGAIGGAIIGAILGAIIGRAIGRATGGALVGALIGALIGAFFDGAFVDAISGAIVGAIVGVIGGAIDGACTWRAGKPSIRGGGDPMYYNRRYIFSALSGVFLPISGYISGGILVVIHLDGHSDTPAVIGALSGLILGIIISVTLANCLTARAWRKSSGPPVKDKRKH